MTDLIDRDALLKKVVGRRDQMWVRSSCGCLGYKGRTNGLAARACKIHHEVEPDDFCSYGERKEDAE